MLKLIPTLFLLALAFSCTKLDTTDVGQNLIPPVDGVNTFATDTFTISCENGIFTDTSKVFKTDEHILGNLQNNSSFGATNASIYVQFNPSTQFSWRAKKDSIMAVNTGTTVQGFDSAFLCLGLSVTGGDNGIYGDTNTNMKFEVYRVSPTATFKRDSSYRLAYNPGITEDPQLIGDLTIAPKDLKKFNRYRLKSAWDSTNNQVRIKLNANGAAWVRNNWLHKDTSNVFNSLANFTAANNGFVIKATSGNAALKVSLANNPLSRFEVWYKFIKDAKEDTTAQSFYFNSNTFDTWATANANYINRTTAGSAMQTSTAVGTDNLVYLESTPGSFTKIKMPFLKNFPNKLIHRAELIIQEDAAFINEQFYSPSRLFLDCFDTVVASPLKNITVPYDYYYNNGTADFTYYGGDRKLRLDPITGKSHSNYTFNVTKHFQNMITRNTTNYDFRLYVPFDTRFYSQALGYYYNFGSAFENQIWPLINTPVFGRVVVGGGTGSYKMKLRVIYSNI